jgi:hypothetical protein
MCPELLTKKEVATRLKICQRTLDRLRETKRLPWLNLGSGAKPLVRFQLSDIEAFETRSLHEGDRHETSPKKGEEWLTARDLAKFLGLGLEEFGRMLLDPALLRLHKDGLFPLSKVVEYLDGNIDKGLRQPPRSQGR